MSRAIWKGSISFGLINIPVQLMGAQEEKPIHFSMLDQKDRSKIHYKKVNATTQREVNFKNIVKGYEYKKGEFVIVTDEDFKSANPKATQTIDIEDFIDLAEIDFMFFEKPYYLTPQKGAEKVYFLLLQRLEALKKVAVAKIIIRTKQHLCAVIPKEGYLLLEILKFAHEVLESHEVDYLDKKTRFSFGKKEVAMADALIKKMAAPWKPQKYKDTYKNDLMKLIKAKVKNGEDFTPEQESDEIEPTSNVVDLLPLLEKSLGISRTHNMKKAPKNAGGTASRTARKATSKRKAKATAKKSAAKKVRKSV